jgi:hypothetical protein
MPTCVRVLFVNGSDRNFYCSHEAAAYIGGTEQTPWLPRSPEEEDAASTPPPGEPVIVTAREMQSLPIASGGLSVQPDRGWALVNMDTIVYTGAQEQVFDIVLLGVPVQVRVEPVEYSWDFGDGSPVVVGTDPGAPWPDYTVAHAYDRAGTVQISLTTQWAGRFQVAGSPDWLPVNGRAVTHEVTEPIEIVTATPKLVVPGG